MKFGKTCYLIFSLLIGLTLGACSGSNNVGTSASNPSSSAFPQGLTVSSPFEDISEAGGSSIIIRALVDEEGIDDILNGTVIADCAPDSNLTFFTQDPANDDCYGPTVDYNEHPDGDPGNSGTLPPGDVGLWTADSASGDESCSSAELTARMEGTSAKTTAALKLWASVLCVLNVESVSESEITNAMNSMATTNGLDLTFSDVTVSVADTSSLSLEVSDGDNSVNLSSRHESNDDGSYEGSFAYAVNTTQTEGNCPNEDGDAPVTLAGDVSYTKDADNNIVVASQDAVFCGSDAAVDGSIDPNDKYDEATNDDGWGDTFTVFMAEYDNDTLIGNYALAWQAGPDDDNTRVFNIGLEQAGEGSTLSGRSYFGYGPDVAEVTFDGGITGFICNWAGPGSDHTLVDFVQRQEISEDADGNFQADSSNIQYAPTVACSYDPDVDGEGFEYDLDGDGTISADEMTDVADGIENELADLLELDFTLPTAL